MRESSSASPGGRLWAAAEQLSPADQQRWPAGQGNAHHLLKLCPSKWVLQAYKDLISIQEQPVLRPQRTVH